ncbi:MAG: hypothetical protein ACXVEF_36055, partial [Polyangiales bacterium]
MSRRLALGTVMSAFVMLGCAAAAPGPGEEQSGEPPLVAEVTKDLSLGTFLFEVDPSLPADQMVKVSDITAATKTITRPGQVAQATVTEVTSTVAVYNATSPVWTTSGAGGYTTLKFGVWNKDSANALDEPYLRIDSITITSGSGTVTFAENSTPANHTFVAGSTSGNYGTYYLADMNAYCTSGTGCTGSARDYAVQQMRINASSSTMAYSFVAKVYATQVSDTTGNPGIYPDLDQDTFNTEPYNQ